MSDAERSVEARADHLLDALRADSVMSRFQPPADAATEQAPGPSVAGVVGDERDVAAPVRAPVEPAPVEHAVEAGTELVPVPSPPAPVDGVPQATEVVVTAVGGVGPPTLRGPLMTTAGVNALGAYLGAVVALSLIGLLALWPTASDAQAALQAPRRRILRCSIRRGCRCWTFG